MKRSCALLAAAVILLCGIAPAQITAQEEPEPLALYTLGRAAEGVSTPLDEGWRTDTVTFTIDGLVENYDQMEYKIAMEEGDTLLYSWTASAPLYYEFHGHTLNDDGSFGEAMLYRLEEGQISHGVVQAPLEGLHGWYFLNRTYDTPIEVELTLAGTYRLEPGLIWQR